MAYVGNQPFGKTVRTTTSETLTSVKTQFYPSGGYTVGYVDVYLNGSKLAEVSDYTATNGSLVTLLFNPEIGDTVEIITYGSVEIANAVRKSGDTMSGDLVINGNMRVGGTMAFGASATAYGTSGQVLTSAGQSPPVWTNLARQIQPISASVASNALTISASELTLEFRSTTLGSGSTTIVTGTPANLVISSGSTLGTINATQSKIVVVAMNNAGTIELAAVNISGGNQLDETNLISTTAEGGAGAADSANVIYSTTARTSLAYRVIGYVESTQSTAGTWATAPSTIQGFGGQSLNAMSSLGYGQTWQNVTGSRSLGTTYTNTTGRPIMYAVYATGNGGFIQAILNASINGVSILNNGANSGTAGGATYASFTLIVPPGATYSASNGGGCTLQSWFELR